MSYFEVPHVTLRARMACDHRYGLETPASVASRAVDLARNRPLAGSLGGAS